MSEIRINDLPDDIRNALAEVAGAQGQSLQDYPLDALAEQARFAHNAEILQRLPVSGGDTRVRGG